VSNTARAAVLGAAVLLLGGLAFVLLSGEDETAADAPSILSAGERADAIPSPPDAAPIVGGAEETPRALEPAEVAAGEGHAAAPPEAAAATPSGDAARLAITVRGRLVDPSGRGVAGARVRYVPPGTFLGSRVGTPPDELQDTTSGPDGRFELSVRVDPPDDDGFGLPGLRDARLAVTHDAYATHLEGLGGVGRSSGTHEVGPIELERGALVRGRVVDEAGRPLADARVSARVDREAMPSPLAAMVAGGALEALDAVTTGADGRFVVRGLRPGPGRVTARLEGRRVGLVDDLTFDVDAPAETGDIVLEAGRSIAGTLVDETGAPIADALVSVSSFSRIMVTRLEDLPREQIGQEFTTTATTDEQGHFEIAGLSGGNYTVHARTPGLEPVDRQNVAAGTRDLVLVARRLGGLLVELRDARTGAPVDGATIEAEPRAPAGVRGFRIARGDGDDGGEAEVLTGAQARAAAGADGPPEGAYFLEGIGAAGTTLTILADGYARLVHEAPAVFGDDVEALVLDLVAESRVAGVVLTPDGEPIEGARVTLGEPAVSVEDGEVRVERRASFGGGGEVRHRTETDAAGRFVLAGVEAGRWELRARADDFVDAKPVRFELEQGRHREGLELVLDPAGAIAGTVFDARGRPAAGQRVRAELLDTGEQEPADELGRLLAALGDGGGGLATATADGQGRYRLDGLRPGPYEVALLAGEAGMRMGGGAMFLMASGDSGETLGTPVRVVVEAGEVVPLDLTRPQSARIDGRVLAGGEPVPGAHVALQRDGTFVPLTVAEATAGEDGRYAFEEVDPGEYTVQCLLTGAAIEKTAEVAVDPGEQASADLVFGTGTIAGRVLDAGTGEGVADVTVEVAPVQDVEPSGGTPQSRFVVETRMVGPGGGSGMRMTLGGGAASSVRTDADGAYRVRYLDAGEYSVSAEGAGYLRGEIGPVAVEEGARAEADALRLERGGVVRGTVVAAETGSRLDEVPVRLVGDDGSFRTMTHTDAGDFLFEGLPAGGYTVEVLGSGFTDEPLASESLVLGEGETRSVTLRAESQT